MNVLYTYQRLSGQFENTTDYITCLKMLKIELNEKGLEYIERKESFTDGFIYFHFMYTTIIPEGLLSAVTALWNQLRHGIGLPEDPYVVYGHVDDNHVMHYFDIQKR